MSKSFDFVIAGAGIMGLAIARELHKRMPASTIAIFEKEARPGMHASGRNSGVLHTGIYYASGSLKAQLCSEGAREMAQYCVENKLPTLGVTGGVEPVANHNRVVNVRFRTSGKNWEARRWTLAPCLVELAEQIDALHPTSHPTDGTVAGKAHDKANPSSDHRPFPWSAKTGAVVRALDAGETVENDAFAIAEAIRLSRDPRIKYVLHEGRMYSSYPSGIYKPYTWRPYSGPPHITHVHFSTLAAFDNDTRPWTIKQGRRYELEEAR